MGLGRENATEYIPDLDRKIFFQKYFKISYYLFFKNTLFTVHEVTEH